VERERERGWVGCGVLGVGCWVLGGEVERWGGIAFTGKKLMGYFFGIQEIMHSYHANSSAVSSAVFYKDSSNNSSITDKLSGTFVFGKRWC
jgi:hypothetical protein